MTYLLDYSAGKLTGAQVRDAGYGGAIRYIDAPELLGTKHTSISEYQSLLAAGRTVYLVFERLNTDADAGLAQGVNNARRALAGAQLLGYTGPIFFCKDENTPVTAANVDYIRGAANVLGWARTGGYGFRSFIAALQTQTPCSTFWQCGRRSELLPKVQLWQDNNWRGIVGGVTVDRNELISPLPNGSDVLTPDDGNTQWAAVNTFTGDTEKKSVADWLGETSAVSRHVADIVAPMYNELDDFRKETAATLAAITAQVAKLAAASGAVTDAQLDAAFTRALPVLKVTGQFEAK